MKLVVQRVLEASVEVDSEIVGKIDKGFLVLIGIKKGDTKEAADYLVKKLCNLRVFSDEDGKMNLNLKKVGGKLLIVSQFTLYANCSKGNRPSYIEAMKNDEALQFYDLFNKELKKYVEVETGEFGEDMRVLINNIGPTTIWLER